MLPLCHLLQDNAVSWRKHWIWSKKALLKRQLCLQMWTWASNLNLLISSVFPVYKIPAGLLRVSHKITYGKPLCKPRCALEDIIIIIKARCPMVQMHRVPFPLLESQHGQWIKACINIAHEPCGWISHQREESQWLWIGGPASFLAYTSYCPEQYLQGRHCIFP